VYKRYFLFSLFYCLLLPLIFSVDKVGLNPVFAQEISFFRTSPRLVRSHSTFTFPNAISTYIFEIEIPKEAENSLNKIIINQQQNTETINFFPDKTKAFIINNNQQILIDNVKTTNNIDDNKNEIIIELNPSIPAGNRVKLEVKARNPLYGGIYQFGVTAYPQGENSRSLYLGIARFHFDQPGGRF